MTNEVRVVHDEYQQPWMLTPDDGDLYEHAQTGTVYPLALLARQRGFGWWTCFTTQEEWLKQCQVPIPDHKLLDGLSSANDHQLREYLQRFGGYVSWLEAQIGVMEGRRTALKQTYEASILVHSAAHDERGTERSKEARIIAKNATLKETKRRMIETDTLIATAKGLLEAYQRAWESVSRVISIRIMEGDLATRRHP